MNREEADAMTQPIPVTEIHTISEVRESRTGVNTGVYTGINEVEPIPQVQLTDQPVDKAVMQLRAEELVPTKQWVETGAVLVRKGVETHPQTIPVEVMHEEVRVDRVPINRVLAEGEVAAPWQDGEVLVVPVVREELVVTKRYVVTEELRIAKVRVPGVQEVSDTVRREVISLDTTGNVRVMPGGGGDPNPTGA